MSAFLYETRFVSSLPIVVDVSFYCGGRGFFFGRPFGVFRPPVTASLLDQMRPNPVFVAGSASATATIAVGMCNDQRTCARSNAIAFPLPTGPYCQDTAEHTSSRQAEGRFRRFVVVPNSSPAVHDAHEQDDYVARQVQRHFGLAAQGDQVSGILSRSGKTVKQYALAGMELH
jgi:hypothetical protein